MLNDGGLKILVDRYINGPLLNFIGRPINLQVHR